MKKMSELELLSLLDRAEQDAGIYNGQLNALNTRLLKDYLGEPYGDEIEDQSQVVSPDVQDVVESDMPSLARVFLGSRQPITFEPTTGSPEEAQEVDEKNQYVNHLIMDQSDSYRILFNWMKEAEILKNSVVKYYMDDSRKTKEVHYENVDESELFTIYESLGDAEVVGQSQNDDGTYNLSFKVTEGKNKLVIANVPSEQFLITKNAPSLEDAELVGDRIEKTRGQLIAEGYKRKLVEMLPSTNEDERDEISTIRDKDQGGSDDTSSSWANEKVEIKDLYIKVDFDGDGIAERRHILKSGQHILINEAFDHVPYASLSAILMPHQLIGRSRAELTQQTQRVKTVIKRQSLDNMYMVNHPRNVVHPDVNIDDLLNVRPNGLVRMKRSTTIAPQQAVFPLATPYVGDKALQMLTYEDHNRAQSTGTLQASQGLEGTGIKEETATRFRGTMEQADAKIELVARNFAETGFRKLYEGVAWLVSQYQDTEQEVMVLGKPLTVNPANWKFDHKLVCKVGTGSASNDKQLQNAYAIYEVQMGLLQMGSPLVDLVKLFNALKEITEALGHKQPALFFNDPEQPEQLLMAENSILKQQMEMLQQHLQQMQNPLAEAETIKQQAFLTKAQSDAQLKAAELTEKVRQFDEKLDADKEKHDQDLALKLTELEQQMGKELNEALMANTLEYDPQTGSFKGEM